MEKFIIQGGNRLEGCVRISGAKNSVVAILPAVLLSDGVCRIENVPNISDVAVTLKILYELGANVRMINQSTFEIDPRGINSYVISKEMSSRMRASTYFIGAMLARFKKARVAPPGGCDFGVRPIDQHIKGFQALGARVVIDNGMVDARALKLTGGPVYLDMASVGATINIMLAATKAEGLTVIENAAKEPHIVDLANFLNSMGADIMGAGTDIIKIRGVSKLSGVNYSIIPDQIEAGTYMAAVCATGGNVLIDNVIPKHLESITAKLIQIGAEVEEYDESLRVIMNKRPQACNVKTMYHPGFPTDMQPQITALLALAEGTSIVTESVWENRFKYTDQLTFMGADVSVEGRTAVVQGVSKLVGAPVSATDLRAGAALIIAGLAAEGTTEIENIEYIDRGYEDVVEKITALGGNIERVNITEPSMFKKAL
ncbi:MAG: UDP-N-acetylglucosamine 1-carboxyvinyltransferase [Clostridia bacterium]|nr:UDP-N-acetylglucosamine 1-carboxyvinyltransferase [Clostridia bacterium]MBQ4130886.1 UDP-N-acetylglucosamine 1-carboxyvinyltransferase [Clostridia bacterium]